MAPRFTVPFSQTLPAVIPVIVGLGFTVIAILLLIYGFPGTQEGKLEVKTTLTTKPF